MCSPIPPPSESLAAHYKFEGNSADSAGTHHGIASGNPGYIAGPTGQAIQLDGADDYVTLPSGVANGKDFTVAAWVYWDGGGDWQRVFDFGNDTTSYMFLTPRSADNTMRFAITTDGNASEQILDTDPLPIGQWVHVAVTLGGNTGVMYINGKPQVAGQILLNPADVNPTHNYLGKSQWPDPLYHGMIDDLQIYDYALDSMQIANLVHPGDFNHDGVVDAADYTVWRDGLGSTYGQADYEIWKTNFGKTAGSGASAFAAASIPEPATILLVFLGYVGVTFWTLIRLHRTVSGGSKNVAGQN